MSPARGGVVGLLALDGESLVFRESGEDRGERRGVEILRALSLATHHTAQTDRKPQLRIWQKAYSLRKYNQTV